MGLFNVALLFVAGNTEELEELMKLTTLDNSVIVTLFPSISFNVTEVLFVEVMSTIRLSAAL
jgi:hypothetical protein